MALNAVLVAWGHAQGTDEARVAAEVRWGRSYVDHLRRLGDSDPGALAPLDRGAAEAARALLTIPVASTGAEALITLHRGPNQQAQQAIGHARAILHACQAAIVDLRTAAH